MRVASYKFLAAFLCLIFTSACLRYGLSLGEPTAVPTSAVKDTPAMTATSIPRNTPTVTDNLPTNDEQDVQAVYATLLKDYPGTTAVLREDTSGDTFTQDEQEARGYIKSNFPNISDETVNAYLARNAAPTKLPADMDLGVSYTLLTTPEFLEITGKSNWGEVLKERYPGSEGVTAFSRVGFNSAHTQALVYVTRVLAPLIGEGGYYLLEYDQGKWEIIDQYINVMS
jgi:hypothetical protein